VIKSCRLFGHIWTRTRYLQRLVVADIYTPADCRLHTVPLMFTESNPGTVPAVPRSAMRILCICLEPTLSASTIKHFGYSTRSCCTEQDVPSKMLSNIIMQWNNSGTTCVQYTNVASSYVPVNITKMLVKTWSVYSYTVGQKGCTARATIVVVQQDFRCGHRFKFSFLIVQCWMKYLKLLNWSK